ncbi:hypothetical protein BD414DRAFT_508573 [Trametes punicea]|nr:hypothetical protein BD414DRAFT_508573 [Trametes punicea]
MSSMDHSDIATPLAPTTDPASSSPESPYSSLSDDTSAAEKQRVDTMLSILHMAAHRGDLQKVDQVILTAFSRGLSKNWLSLYGSALMLKSLGFDFGPAAHALQMMFRAHCERCHHWYDERENGPQACVVPHATPIATLFKSDMDPIPGRHYPCCGLNEVCLSDDAPSSPSLACYVGPHTPSPEPLEVALRTGTCNDLGCYTALAEPSPNGRPASPRSAVASQVPDAVSSGTVTRSMLGPHDGTSAGTAPAAYLGMDLDVPATATASTPAEEPAWTSSSLYHPPDWIPTRLPGKS